MTAPKLSLRLRTFLFFALMAVISVSIVAGALWAGFQRAGHAGAGSGFLTAGVIAGFGLAGLCTAIWRLFDENIARPVEQMAAGLRARTHTAAAASIDTHQARYLGDLGPAAESLSRELGAASEGTARAVEAETARLKAERDRLAALLSDIPLAMVISPSPTASPPPRGRRRRRRG